MADIFLSYAEEDRPIAARIGALLESAGWSVWWDRKISVGKTWRGVLEEALQDMRCMVVLWSSHSIKSDWVKEEAEEGKSQRKLIPILIEQVIPPVGFRSIQAADFSGWDGSSELPAARQLIVDLAAMLGEARPPAASPMGTLPAASERDREVAPGGWLGADSIFASAWRRQTQWRCLAASVAILALLVAGPLSRWSAVDVESAAPSPTAQIDPVDATTGKPGEVDVYTPPVAPVEGSTPISEIAGPVRQSATGSVAAPEARATAISNTRSTNRRCSEILERAQLGEPLSDENRALLQKECQ